MKSKKCFVYLSVKSAHLFQGRTSRIRTGSNPEPHGQQAPQVTRKPGSHGQSAVCGRAGQSEEEKGRRGRVVVGGWVGAGMEGGGVEEGGGRKRGWERQVRGANLLIKRSMDERPICRPRHVV